MFINRHNLITGNRCFSGPSDQEKASEQLYNESKNINPNVKNRFNNYSDPYGFGEIEGKLNEAFGGQEDLIKSETSKEMLESKKGAAESFASRGITGGSVLTDTQGKIGAKINESKSDALANLGINKAGSLAKLMEYFNEIKFKQEKAATDVDFGNFDNLMAKYGLQGTAIAGLSDTTWLDDAFAGLDIVGNLASGGGDLFSALSGSGAKGTT